jgi:lipoprotein-releasing system permease protein
MARASAPNKRPKRRERRKRAMAKGQGLKRFELMVAFRYLTSSGLQTWLILAGISIGIIVFTFMASLINGLKTRITNDIAGNLAHVTLEPPEREPIVIGGKQKGELVARVESDRQQRAINGWRQWIERIERMPGVRVVAPNVSGGGFVVQGERVRPVQINGIQPDKINAIADIGDSIVRGTSELNPGEVLIGIQLAEKQNLDVGQKLNIRSERNRERSLYIRGIFDTGNNRTDEGTVYMELATAQGLLDLQAGVRQLQVKLLDLNKAREYSADLGKITGLKATNWIDENRRLQDAMRSQSSTGNLIKAFSMLTIVVGVASVLLVAAVRRRSEIGIMRSMGVTQRSVVAIFVLQGFLLGAAGSVLGAGVGFLFGRFLQIIGANPAGRPTFPIDPSQGEYLPAILLATFCCSLAAVLPARSAAKVDPVEAIQQ